MSEVAHRSHRLPLVAPTLLAGLLDDAALLTSGRPAREVVAEHAAHRAAAYAPLVGSFVVPDTQLAEVGRHHRDGPDLAVQVVNSGGAGGLLGLSRRTQPGLDVVGVISMLRDLDDLAGNAARVVAAAEVLDPEITLFVGLPYAHGWPRAVEVIEAAGHCAVISPGDPAGPATPRELIEQLAGLIDADLPFKIGTESAAYPLTGLLDAVRGLIDGMPAEDAVQRLGADRDLRWATDGEADAQRVRRRLRSVNCAQVSAVATGLSRLD